MPLYSDFIKERFERCLDLYLAPRARRMRLHVPSPEALLPQLPKPQDLQPFPTTLMLKFLGHTGKVSSRQALMTSDVCDLWQATLFQAKRDW